MRTLVAALRPALHWVLPITQERVSRSRLITLFSNPLFPGWLWLLFAGAVTVVYRGLTQSLTTDEAYAYHLFLNQKAAVLFEKYDAAYHVLHTWASWLAVHKFGKSEAILRLPSMVAGLFYLVGVGVLCKRITADRWRFLAAVVLLSANPLVADYLSAARGYGAALAFFVWAFDALLSHRPARASALMALSVACNLTFLVPAAAASAVYLVYRARAGEQIVPLVKKLALPFFAIAIPILAVPLLHAEPSNFYYGAPDFGTSLNTLVESSLAHGDAAPPAWAGTTARAVLPLLAAAMLLWGIRTARERAFHVTMAAGALLLSTLTLVAAHQILGVPYPWTRTGLYLIWLFLVLCLTLWEATARERGFRGLLPLVFGTVCVLLAGMFVAQFETRYYYDFRDDAQVNAMMRRVSTIDSGRPACIGGSWRFEPTVNYYRLRYRLTWIEEMKRTPEPQSGCRFLILESTHQDFLNRLGLRLLWRDPLSGAILAEAAP
ncbi:MAG TPA: hypothetical protein PLA43_08455 [Bryobacteraceae bacterium]|nr:hypothetical protein [Bryobacteraceae bacterium]HPU71975.1 hypothetical protein [Bryobacteraceae bacterium]